ncbi:MAG: T9SS type A sorting domain-containing protein [Candidatus Krumholzibacteria bacterium]|nr:T9SS type A sorting domain-containing protein [Candidatus Krumholzibacteria bacterium]
MRKLAIIILSLIVLTPSQSKAQDRFEIIHRDIIQQMDALRGSASWERGMLMMPDPTPAQLEYDVIRYDIDIAIDHSLERVEGRVGIEFESLVDGFLAMDIDIDPVLEILSVTASGYGELTWVNGGSILQVTLPGPLATGEQFRVDIYYQGYPAGAAHPGLFFRSYEGAPVIYSLSEPWGARTWYPCKDYPDDKALFDIQLAVDPSLIATSNGEFIGASDTTHWGAPYRRFQWKENYPMANYLFSVTASDYVVLEEPWVYAPGETMMVTNYVYPSKIAQATEDFNIQIPVLDFFSSIYGLYPFVDEKYGIAHCAIGGGMEHQTLTSYGAALTLGSHKYDYVWVHELSHQWFGDLVTCSDWVNIWLNEGWASYSEALWFEHIEGAAKLRSYMETKDTPHLWDGPVLRDPDNDDPWYYFNIVVYHKGAWTLHMLRHILGDGTFFAASRAYLEDPRYRFSYANTDEMRQVFEDHYGASLSWFFDQWLTREDRLVYSLTWDQFEAGGENHLSCAIAQTQVIPYTMPVDMRITTTSGTIDTILWIDEPLESFTIVTSGPVTSVEIDPDHWILCDVELNLTDSEEVPSMAFLGQNIPNPFNPVTTIEFGLEVEGRITLDIFDVNGRLVRKLASGHFPAGRHTLAWKGLADNGSKVSSGVYFYRLTSGSGTINRKMVLLR